MKVQFLKDTSKAIIPENLDKKSTLVLYREGFGYKLPPLKNAEFLEFEKYKILYQKLAPELIILVGANRIINPSNRCDFVFEHLTTMTPNIPKISIDNSPFISEPWRLWFHYAFCNCGKFNINYSYIIETEWKHWFYREIDDCRLSVNNIKNYITDTYSDLLKLIAKFSLSDIDNSTIDWYSQIKQNIFNKYDTPKLIIMNLLKEVEKKFEIGISYNSYLQNKSFNLPNLGIYRFIKEENERRLNIYNSFCN